MTTFQFDATSVDPDQGRLGPMPAGNYSVMIKEAVLEPNSQGTGQIVKVQLSVIDAGDYKDRVIYTNFNVANQSDKAQEIGQKQFSALLHAIDVLQIQDTSQIVNKTLKVRIKIKPADGDYEARNEVTAYRGINDTSLNEASGAANGAKPGTNSSVPAIKAPNAPPPRPAAPTTPAGQAPLDPPKQPWMGEDAGTAPSAPVQAAPSAPAQAPTAPAPVATAPVAPAAPVLATNNGFPTYLVVTEKAGTTPYSNFQANNWTDKQLVEHGYATEIPKAETAPAAPTTPAGPTGGEPPPWESGDAQS